MAGLEPYKHGYYLWKYVPSAIAAGIFCMIFILITVAHGWRIWKTRTWFCIPFAIGGYMQVVGYASRAAAASRTGSLVPFVIQQNNILFAPVLYAASIYMTLGRIIRSVKGEKYAMISPRWLTALFLGGDILALAVQGSAAGLMVVAEYAKMAQGIAIAGLVIQVITFGLFWITSWMFHLKMRRNAEATCLISDEVKWEQSMRMLYGVSALIMLRSVFRLIEFTVGVDGYLLSHEWPLYIFDAVPIVCVMCIFWHWFPSSATQPQKTMFVPL